MKIGIMSFAHLHAEAYIHNLRAAPEVEFIGIADEDLARGQQFAELYDTYLFASYEALLATKPDAVVICSGICKLMFSTSIVVGFGVSSYAVNHSGEFTGHSFASTHPVTGKSSNARLNETSSA